MMTTFVPPTQPVPRPTVTRAAAPLNWKTWLVTVLLSALLSLATVAWVTTVWMPTEISIRLPGTTGGPRFSLSSALDQDQILLVMGVDVNSVTRNKSGFDNTRTDTMMLVRLSPKHKTVSIVSIPRDSKVYLADGRGVDKVNAAHALGGPELAVKTVEQAFGIPIDHYMVLNLHGVKDLVDTLGGVRVQIDKPMRYVDHTAKLRINFQPGMQDLNGADAERFLRFRHDAMADIGRIKRQQLFLAAVAQKLKSPWAVTKLPGLVGVAAKHAQTDMNPDELFRVAVFMKDLDLQNVRVATLPGRPSGGPISYWVVDPVAAQAVLDRLVLNHTEDQSQLEAPMTVAQGDSKQMTVGILYHPGVGERLPVLVSRLKEQSFRVTCQSPRRDASTQIVEHTQRVTREATARLRQTDATLGKAHLIFSPVGGTYEPNACSGREDYTVILGQDTRS